MITKKDIFCGCKCFLVKCVNCRGCKYYFSDVTSLFCFPEADVALRFWIFWENPTLDSRAKIIWLGSELKKKALENGFSESVPAMQATSENVTDPMFSRESYWPGAPLLPVLTCFTSFFLSFPWQSLPVGIMGLVLARSRRPSPMLVGKAAL